MEKLFFNAEEVAEVMGISTAYAYKVIQRMNKELKKKGFIRIRRKESSTIGKWLLMPLAEKCFSISARGTDFIWIMSLNMAEGLILKNRIIS